ncbi:MAG: low molecular weight protein arginine phosphatase [Candidatus Zixiibacteriota bacterium]
MSKSFVVLFVCTGNTCRSPMAEGALRLLLSKEQLVNNFEIISAGTAAASGFPATMYAIEAAKLWDVDLSHHLSQPLTTTLIDKADLILVMTESHRSEVLRLRPGAKDRTYLFKNFPDPSANGEGVEDPIGQSLDVYQKTFLEIGEYLGKHLPEIVRRINGETNCA